MDFSGSNMWIRLMELLCHLMDPNLGQRTIVGTNGWCFIESMECHWKEMV